jgi:hypothetical protein
LCRIALTAFSPAARQDAGERKIGDDQASTTYLHRSRLDPHSSIGTCQIVPLKLFVGTASNPNISSWSKDSSNPGSVNFIHCIHASPFVARESWYHSVLIQRDKSSLSSTMLFHAILSRRLPPRQYLITSYYSYSSIATLLSRTPKKHSLVERLDHSILMRSVDVAGSVALAQPEDRLDDRELGGSSVKTYPYH